VTVGDRVEAFLEAERQVIDAGLDRVLPAADRWPQRLHRAMRYAVLGGGKRVRPILARLSCRAAGGDPDAVTDAVCGLELIHTYSLVHDDLPALDDDTLRRGRRTVHVEFDEATAILVGDALLTEGLLILASLPSGPTWAARRGGVVECVASAISSRGMVGGQMEDLEATGQVHGDPGAEPAQRLERIHRHKTGHLLRAAVEAGGLLAGASDAELLELSRWGECLGLAFQVADDILDATASAAQLGKSPGKDAAAGKLTYVTLYGLESARRRLADLEAEMVALAASVEGPAGPLADLARFVAERRR
jgi:geranylgeranyl pyrophosphate synthase